MFSLIVFFLFLITNIRSNTFKSLVIQVNGDCGTYADKIAHEHGYRYVRQIFDGFCELEEDPTSINHHRHRRAIEEGIDPAHIVINHENVQWAESQYPKIRKKREFIFDDPEYNNMWYLMRHTKRPDLPDLNVTGAWELGYTGRGRIVTFLDDGLEYDHPDIQENYDKDASIDINENDPDPMPRYDPSNENKHGTRCAGEVSAKANNSVCGVGLAYHARVGGIRMLDGDITDSVEARSISHRPDHVEIYSASWGPDDNGLVVDGPGILAKRAFENGIAVGRNGKGSIYVWASGNGGRSGDSCACDGYINSIYTIAISSATEKGEKPWYLEECSATLASSYSSGQGGQGLLADHDIITTDLHHGCTSHHSGTSAAAPLAAAIYALVLEANPELTWRDIMYITVLGSRPHAIPSNVDFIRNAAGYNVSSKFGFGLMDAGLMTWYAQSWINIPPMLTCETSVMSPNKVIAAHATEQFEINIENCQDKNDTEQTVNYIEQVQIIVSLTTTKRGEIEIYLYSPSNTKTQILPQRRNDHSNQGFSNWAFLTVQLWGENPHGKWKFQIVNTGDGSATLTQWQLAVHGTRDYPISFKSANDSRSSNCHIECNPVEPCGSTDTNCTSCRHYKQLITNEQFRCVGICPEGTYGSESNKTCLPCHEKCAACRNASENSCVSCKSGQFLIHDLMICSESCPVNYFTDQNLRKCIRCKSDCATCETNSYVCTSCQQGYAIKGSDCVKAAGDCKIDEYYDFEEERCRWCDSRCLSCSGFQSTQCTSCISSSKYPYLQYHTCVSACSPGFYLSTNVSQCLSCHETCLNCTSSNESSCSACKIGYIYMPESHRCEKYTGKAYYIDSGTSETRPCHSSCTQCKGPKPTDCTACNLITEVLLNDGHCVNDCPEAFFMTENRTNETKTNICLPCPSGCTRCDGEASCVRCNMDKGFYLQDRMCVPTCNKGLYLDGKHCEKCQKPCQECWNLTSCLTCQNKYALLGDQCHEKCPDGYYRDDTQCLPCHPLCGTCQGLGENDCKTCAEGYQFDGRQKKCLSLCPNGNFYNKLTQSCEICTGNCFECAYPGSYCLQCAYPMSLDTTAHECYHCCSTNETKIDCCQCPSVWDGFCRHRLSTSSSFSSIWWIKAPVENIQNQFKKLNRSHQLVVLIVLVLVILISGLSFFVITIRSFNVKRKVLSPDYIPLTILDDEDLD